MAFNPFHSFRKHAKVYFAILTIICMVTFILAFGQGDALTWITNKFSGGRKGEKVATLYGDAVYQRDLEVLRYHRAMAEDFLRRGIELDAGVTAEEAISYLQTTPTPDSDFLARDARARFRKVVLVEVFNYLQGIKDPEQKQKLNNALMQVLQKDPSLFQQSQQSDRLESIVFELRLKKMEQELDLAERLLAYSTYSAIRQNFGDKRLVLFDGTTGTQDLLDFYMWLKQADELGIKFKDADIRSEVNRLAPMSGVLSGKSSEDSVRLRSAMGNRREGDLDELYKALGDELRVAVAKGVILGRLPGYWGVTKSANGSAFMVSNALTPADYIDYYHDKRNEMKVVLLPIPASAFLKDVKAQPDEQELRDLFDLYRDKAPNPNSPSPGFREPERVRIEWISAYRASKETAENLAKALPLAGYLNSYVDPREAFDRQRTLINLMTHLMPRNSFAPLNVMNILSERGSPASTLQLLLLGDREARSVRFHYPLPRLLEGDPTLVFYAAANKPTMHASMVGHFVGSGLLSGAGGGHGAVIRAAAGWQNSMVHQGTATQERFIKKERETRSRIVGQLVMSSIGAPPLAAPALWDFCSPPDSRANEPPKDLQETIPLEVVADAVYERLFERQKQAIITMGFGDFLMALRDAKQDKKREVIDKAIKENRWEQTRGASTYAADEYSITQDPGLRAPMTVIESLVGKRVRPGELFFRVKEPMLYEPRLGSDELQSLDLALWRADFALWRTEYTPGRTPASIGDVSSDGQPVRQKVIAAWRELQARELAKKEAGKIAKNVSEQKTPEAKLKALQAALNPAWGKDARLVTLDHVARRVKSSLLAQAGMPDYVPFLERLAPEDFPNPPGNLVDVLQNIPEGTADVILDRPDRTAYVAYVEKRYPPAGPDEILKERKSGDLWETLVENRARELQGEIVKELRRQAGELDGLGRFKINPKAALERDRKEAE